MKPLLRRFSVLGVRSRVQWQAPTARRLQRRNFHGTSLQSTDGVYREISSGLVTIPYIEALRKRSEGSSQPIPALPQRDLSPRKMSASYRKVILPLAQDQFLLDTYISSSGQIRLGTLFMDLDALSGVIAYKHTGDSVMTVTAAVDRIQIRHSLNEICDLELSGQVTFATGRSSMEISMQVAKAPARGANVKPEDVLITCAFTMVSLDPQTKRPVNVPPLQIDSASDKRLFDLGQKHYEAKKAMSRTALREVTPTPEETQLIHSMWKEQNSKTERRQQDGSEVITKQHPKQMRHTQLRSSQIMQPQHRNRHNFMIFGGFLLKSTFELAFCCAANFSHERPAFLSLDPSTFDNPVPVGSVLYLTATVAYTEPAADGKGTRVQVRVDSRVRDIEHVAMKEAGQFNYTFHIKSNNASVMPQTYSEYMIWIDARRRAQQVNESLDETREAPTLGANVGNSES